MVAYEWFETQCRRWSEVHAGNVINCLEADIFPRLGARSIASIDAPELLAIVSAVEALGVR
ncbi:phage integrase central domain-containing protein [Burkholderia sp. LMG 32019]|uniref:phage integrase central domain-containing protein n=1 Tax=Burkholderia sp. LMG 32019 TaxID=3158173 RepID=UPI003C2BA23F